MKAPIRYSGFYDVPLAFVVRHQGTYLLFRRDFDDDLDDYPDAYEVYALPGISEEMAEKPWAHLSDIHTQRVGQVPVCDVQFDVSKRREMDTAILDTLIAPREAVTV